MLIDAQYKRDLHGHYLVISSEEDIMSYSLKMLLNNKIKGLLNIELQIVDNINQFYYDITSKQAFTHAFENGQLKYNQIKTIIKEIIKAIDIGKEYLLSENDFVLDQNYIYINLTNFEVNLCYLVGYQEDIIKQLSCMIEYLMNKVDYTDEQAVLLIYGLYKISREDSCTIDRLNIFLDKKDTVVEQKNKEDLEKYKEENDVNDSEYKKWQTTKPDHKQKSGIKIPMMQERVQSEEEILVYSKTTKLLAFLSAGTCLFVLLIGFNLGIFQKDSKAGIDIVKVFGLLIILGTLEAYILSKLFHKKNKITKLKDKVEYINSDITIEEHKTKNNNYFNSSNAIYQKDNNNLERFVVESSYEDNKTQLLDFDYEKTTLLVNNSNSLRYKLSPLNPLEYKDIELIEFPFFIGKFNYQLDSSIDSSVISRYHAKIEQKNGEFFITDLNSTNGTFLNSDRLKSNETKLLHLQDEIKFANISFRFELI